VANVEEARAYLEQKRPDLILLDVILPGMDGFTYCRELKADHGTAAIPVVMLTDLAREAGERSLEAGADDYMPKRIDDSIMRIRVNLHLHLGGLGTRATLPAGPASILVASASSQLQAQIANQFTRDGHTVRGVETLQELRDNLAPEVRVLVLDLGLGFNASHEFLVELRHTPGIRHLPVLLIASKEEVRHLESLEHLVDDVLWTPLKAKVFGQRLTYMLKLGHRER
jgi:DNA-binding response OmpR family regulator